MDSIETQKVEQLFSKICLKMVLPKTLHCVTSGYTCLPRKIAYLPPSPQLFIDPVTNCCLKTELPLLHSWGGAKSLSNILK